MAASASTFAATPIDSMARLARLRRIARLMDSSFGLPGTRWRVGLDSLFGLAPVAGDAASALVSLYIVWEAKQLGAPAMLVARMLGNITLDTFGGSVPVLGDLFDAAFKSNLRNLTLLEDWLQHR